MFSGDVALAGIVRIQQVCKRDCRGHWTRIGEEALRGAAFHNEQLDLAECIVVSPIVAKNLVEVFPLNVEAPWGRGRDRDAMSRRSKTATGLEARIGRHPIQDARVHPHASPYGP